MEERVIILNQYLCVNHISFNTFSIITAQMSPEAALQIPPAQQLITLHVSCNSTLYIYGFVSC